METAAPSRPSFPLLSVEGLQINFGGVQAVRNVTFQVERSEVVGLIGPNGAGKTTVLNAISRLNKPSNGRIMVDGVDVLNMRAYDIAATGLSRTFQNLALCPSLSVLDNVILGGICRETSTTLERWLLFPASRRNARRLREEAEQVVEQLGLSPYAHTSVSRLSYGDRRMVELARSLCGKPSLLLLDEPASGLNEREIERVQATLVRLRQQSGVSILIIEHHLDVIMALCDRIVVLNLGSVIADGDAASVRANPVVIEAYLGRAA